MVRSAGDTDTTLPPIIVYQLPSPLSSSRYFELVFYKNGLTESNPSSLHFALAWRLIQRNMKTLVLLSFCLVLFVLGVRGGVRWRRSLFDIIPGVGPGLDSGNLNPHPSLDNCKAWQVLAPPAGVRRESTAASGTRGDSAGGGWRCFSTARSSGTGTGRGGTTGGTTGGASDDCWGGGSGRSWRETADTRPDLLATTSPVIIRLWYFSSVSVKLSTFPKFIIQSWFYSNDSDLR